MPRSANKRPDWKGVEGPNGERDASRRRLDPWRQLQRSARSTITGFALAVGAAAHAPQEPVRRLSPASFPSLPPAVRRDLDLRRCRIPQPWNGGGRQNVIRGAFRAPGAVEWSVLCSIRDTSQILIYRTDALRDARVIDSLERSADRGWIQDFGKGRVGFSRLIRTQPRRQISSWRVDMDQNEIPQPIDHDAIEEWFIEKSARAFYFTRGRWYKRIVAD